MVRVIGILVLVVFSGFGFCPFLNAEIPAFHVIGTGAGKSGSLKITSSPSGAYVKMNRVIVGQTPLEIQRIDIGEVSFEVYKKGYKNLERTIRIKPDQATALSFALSKEQLKLTYTDPTTGMVFVFIPGGCYQMGDVFGDGESDERPVHNVCVDDFYIGKYEVTQKEFKQVMHRNTSRYHDNDRLPVESFDIEHVVMFLDLLNKKASKKYRLPTEAEWEYAARNGGKNEKFPNQGNPSEFAWFELNSQGKTHEVGLKNPNALGVYDLSGNVWELCSDFYSARFYSLSERQNPLCLSREPTQKMELNPYARSSWYSMRGGGYNSRLDEIRVTNRSKSQFSDLASLSTETFLRRGYIGLRLVLQIN